MASHPGPSRGRRVCGGGDNSGCCGCHWCVGGVALLRCSRRVVRGGRGGEPPCLSTVETRERSAAPRSRPPFDCTIGRCSGEPWGRGASGCSATGSRGGPSPTGPRPFPVECRGPACRLLSELREAVHRHGEVLREVRTSTIAVSFRTRSELDPAELPCTARGTFEGPGVHAGQPAGGARPAREGVRRCGPDGAHRSPRFPDPPRRQSRSGPFRGRVQGLHVGVPTEPIQFGFLGWS